MLQWQLKTCLKYYMVFFYLFIYISDASLPPMFLKEMDETFV